MRKPTRHRCGVGIHNLLIINLKSSHDDQDYPATRIHVLTLSLTIPPPAPHRADALVRVEWLVSFISHLKMITVAGLITG